MDCRREGTAVFWWGRGLGLVAPGVKLPGGGESGETEEEAAHRQAVTTSGGGVLQNVVFVVTKVAHEILTEMVELVGGEASLAGKFGGGLGAGRDEDELAQDTETGVATAAAQIGVKIWVTDLELVAHLVGECDEVKLLAAEGLVGDRGRVLVVIIERAGGVGNLGAGEDEAVGGADVFVEHAERELNMAEKRAGEEFAAHGHNEAVFGEHGFQGALGGEVGGEMGVGDKVLATVGVDFTDGAEGDFGVVALDEAVKVGE